MNFGKHSEVPRWSRWFNKPIVAFGAYVMVWWGFLFSAILAKAEQVDIASLPPHLARAALRSIIFSPWLLIPTILVGTYAVVRLLGLHGRTLTLYERSVIGFLVLFVALVHLAVAF